MKRLVVCCDGTWNRPDQVADGVAAPTNVSKLALGVAREDGSGIRQLLYYQQGVGTRPLERIRGGAFGLGLSRNVRACYRFLVESYSPGDELYLFGFSRGAFTARSTVGLVRNAGILRPEHADRIPDAYRLYRSRADPAKPLGLEAQIFRRMHSHEELSVHFVGVWDTVGALGIPIDGVRLPFLTRRWTFHDTELSSRVSHAYHALAIDERRAPFKPTLWRRQDHASGQKLEQVWFSGAHCDVGGGYRETGLSDIALLWMVERARAAGLAFEPDHFLRTSGAGDRERRHRGADVAPDALGTLHESRKRLYRLQPPYRRPLAGPAGSGLSVATSAERRRAEHAAYDPPGLAEYLAAGGGSLTEVTDSPVGSSPPGGGAPAPNAPPAPQ